MSQIKSPELSLEEDSAAAAADIDSRGETVMAKQVIEKIAAQVALDETAAGGFSGGFLGLGSKTDLSARPKTSVQVTGNFAALKIEVALPYPAPLRQASEQLRRTLMERVHQLTGLEIKQVDVRIATLAGRDSSRKRRDLL